MCACLAGESPLRSTSINHILSGTKSDTIRLGYLEWLILVQKVQTRACSLDYLKVFNSSFRGLVLGSLKPCEKSIKLILNGICTYA